tara:strand:+ start:526 stop:798 length:273 start_codon:yes stop_codon:yes gene_type:complete
MNLKWMPVAIVQREHIISFIAEDNIDAAIHLDETIDAKCNRLIDYPLSGRAGRAPETRELIVHPNYLVVYRVVEDTLEVVAFLHAAQRWP